MKDLLRSASETCIHVARDAQPFSRRFVEEYPAQIVSCGLHQLWTYWVEGALGPRSNGAPVELPSSPGSPVHGNSRAVFPTSANSARLALLTSPSLSAGKVAPTLM